MRWRAKGFIIIDGNSAGAIPTVREAAGVNITTDEPNPTIRTVVYATDFSSHSENAGTYAKLLASYFRATLIVAHAFILSQAAMEIEAEEKLESAQRKDLEHLLEQKAFALSTDSLLAVPLLLEGDPHRAIPEFAEANAPSLIVLGTHGGGRLQRGLIGSVAETILRSTRWPCLTVGPDVPSLSSSCATLPFKRILCATDLTPAATQAVVFASSLAEACESEIDVLHVIPERAVKHPGLLEEIGSRFYDSLDQLVPERARELSHPRTFVEVGHAHRRILEHAQERSVDLLVLGIHKTSHLGLEMRTSGAFRMIVEAKCPVLTMTG